MWRKSSRNPEAPFLGFPAPYNFVDSFAYAPDSGEKVSQRLFDISLEAIVIAASTNFGWLKSLGVWDSLLDIFPGEHYRLLSGLTQVRNSLRVCEIGTFKGMGAIALWNGSPEREITTYDILSLSELNSIIPKSALENGAIVPRIGDLSDPSIFEQEKKLLAKSQVVFLDGPKDGKFEYEFLRLLSTIDFEEETLLIIDDIRFVNMIPLWRSIKNPKLDLTSFGHWSGTGVVLIQRNLLLK